MLKTIGGGAAELGAAPVKAKVEAEAAKAPSLIVIIALIVLVSAGIAFAMVRWQVDGRLGFLEDSRKTMTNDLEALRAGLGAQTASAPAAGVEELRLKVEGLELAMATSSGVIASNTLAIGVLTARQAEQLAAVVIDAAQSQSATTPVASEVETPAVVEPSSKLCTEMAKTISGRTRMPIDAKYGNLDILGQIFTAADCGQMRLEQITWLEDSPKGGLQYSFGLNLNLKNPPSPELLAQLLVLGFDCETKSMFAVCRDWVANKVLTVAELQKLQFFVAEIDTDSSLR